MDRLSKAFLVIAAIGIPDAVYHAIDEISSYYLPFTNVCNINSWLSCSTVFQSGYTSFFGVSLWVYGVVWFPLIFTLGWWYIKKKGGLNVFVMLPLLMVGNIFTVYPLWFYEFTLIHAFCLVCISMYCLNYIMTGLAMVVALRQE